MNDARRLLTSAELAEWLQVPAGTLDQWSYRGVGPPAIRVGKHRRYRIADVERWLDEQTTDRAKRGEAQAWDALARKRKRS